MAKKAPKASTKAVKATRSPSARPSKGDERFRLAGAVAAKVDITEVRLFSSVMQLGEPKGKRSELTWGSRARVLPPKEPERLRVFADFFITESRDDDEPRQEIVPVEGRLFISATFRLDYGLPQIADFSEQHLRAFGEINGVYNAWPFWREYVYSTMARMGLPPITMPVYRPADPGGASIDKGEAAST